MRELLVYGLETTFTRAERCVDDVSDEESRARPHGLSPIIWQLGHIVTADAGYLRRAGGTLDLPGTYRELFATGTGGDAPYPPLAELRRYFEDVQRGLVGAARTADLSMAVEGQSYHTAGEVLAFVAYHRGYHIGKMTTLRALVEKPRLFG
jgi:uncharacterized damage-inducible protein DinB